MDRVGLPPSISPAFLQVCSFLFVIRCHGGGWGVAHWVIRLARNVEVMGSSPINAPPPFVFLSKKLYPYCLGFYGCERDFTVELN